MIPPLIIAADKFIFNIKNAKRNSNKPEIMYEYNKVRKNAISLVLRPSNLSMKYLHPIYIVIY